MKKTILLLLLCVLYSILRYRFFGDSSSSQIPVFLLNKALALASSLFLFLAALAYRKDNREDLRHWGKASLHAASLHVLLSLAVFSRAYYPKLFDGSSMSLSGEIMILSGSLAAFSFYFLRKADENISLQRFLPLLASLFLAIHTLSLGLKGWMQAQDWHGSLPPISLWGFAFSLLASLLFCPWIRRGR